MDEYDLRSGLRALTLGAPPAPPERVRAAVRRSAGIRRRRAVASVAAVAALATPAALLVTRPPDRVPPVAGPTPVHLWPDRTDPSLRAAADRAVAEFNPLLTSVPYGETPRVLWSARVPGTRYVAVVYAFCGPSSCSSAVLATNNHPDPAADDGDESLSHWLTVRRTITNGVLDEPLAVYLSSGESSPLGDTNVLLVVAEPEATAVRWSSPARRAGTGGEGELPKAGHAFVGDIGYVSATTTVVVSAGGRTLAEGIVGERGESSSVGGVPWVAELEEPAGWTFVVRGSSQLEDGNTGLTALSVTGTWSVFVRCDGFAPVVVEVEGRRTPVPCDKGAHRVDARLRARVGTGAEVRLHGDPYTAYTYAIAQRAP